LINLQWYVLVLTLRLAVYSLFGKARLNLGKNFLHPQKYALPYAYGCIVSHIRLFALYVFVSNLANMSKFFKG